MRINELCARPFSSVEEMNDALTERWNERVDDEDTVWVLGDFAMGPIRESLALTGRLKGRKYLICGNHDRPFAGYPGSDSARAEWRARYLDAGFVDVVDGSATRRTGNVVTLPLRTRFGALTDVTVGLSHFPTSGDTQGDDRYAEYRPRTRPGKRWAVEFAALLHGHVHNGWTMRTVRHGKRDLVEINVGVDVWDFAPVSSETLIALLRDGMPPCSCGEPSGDHAMGSPGCAVNGGPTV